MILLFRNEHRSILNNIIEKDVLHLNANIARYVFSFLVAGNCRFLKIIRKMYY